MALEYSQLLITWSFEALKMYCVIRASAPSLQNVYRCYGLHELSEIAPAQLFHATTHTCSWKAWVLRLVYLYQYSRYSIKGRMHFLQIHLLHHLKVCILHNTVELGTPKLGHLHKQDTFSVPITPEIRTPQYSGHSKLVSGLEGLQQSVSYTST